jgi:hypothetical protein
MQTQPAYNSDVGWPNKKIIISDANYPVSDLIISVLCCYQKLCLRTLIHPIIKISAAEATVAVGLQADKTWATNESAVDGIVDDIHKQIGANARPNRCEIRDSCPFW